MEAIADVFERDLFLKESTDFSRSLRILNRSISPEERVWSVEEPVMGMEGPEEEAPDVPVCPGVTKCPDLSRFCSTSIGG